MRKAQNLANSTNESNLKNTKRGQWFYLCKNIHFNKLTVFQFYFRHAAKSFQSCPTLCNPTDSSPSGSSVPGILQARILEWVAISFFNACMLSHFSRVRLCATQETAAHQTPPSLGFSRQEHWSGLPFPSPMHECEK